MTTQAHEAVVRRSIVVDAPIERAFHVFTAELGSSKPKDHNLLRAEIAETVLEPRVGGNIYDRAVDGSECRWARVLAYEPPDRVVFSWDISPRRQVETDPERTSEVEVRFVTEASGRTRVELEHRGLERHGEVGKASATASRAPAAGRSTSSVSRRSPPADAPRHRRRVLAARRRSAAPH